jgi:DnaB helicase-like protein/AAA domain-containing protein
MPTSLSDAVAQTERSFLGSVLLDNSLWSQTDAVSADDFSLDSHRRIYQCMAALVEDQHAIDENTLPLELDQRKELARVGGIPYISALLNHAYPEKFSDYVRDVLKVSRERRFERLQEQLIEAGDTESRLNLLQQMQEALTQRSAAQNWRRLFHSYDEVINVPTASFAIDGFLQEDGITLIGGLAGHGKTLCMLAMVRALLEGGKLFHHFAVTKKAERVIYLIPEAGRGPFASRLKTFHLEQYVREEKLFCRTLSAQGQLSLADPRILEAAKGADVFLDTAIRFMTGDENSAAEQRAFADSLFALQRAGARTITGAHHSPKSFGKDTYMTLENVLRGSGDIGAMLATCWGLSQIDTDATRIFVQNVKARDFLPCQPFIIQGRPSIDTTGYFELPTPPGFAGTFSENKPQPQVGRPQVADKDEKITEARKMHEDGKGYREIATALGVSVGTVSAWLSKRSKTVQ